MGGNPNVLTSKFSIGTHPLEVLFDSGAAHSFISAILVETLGLVFNIKVFPATHSPPGWEGAEL